ncbi:MAG: hypothetical protein KGP27_10110, partial [Hyphomicrobiales bacterium]|nr:hypothetical protein [Hyphomicrobiales bacterium]
MAPAGRRDRYRAVAATNAGFDPKSRVFEGAEARRGVGLADGVWIAAELSSRSASRVRKRRILAPVMNSPTGHARDVDPSRADVLRPRGAGARPRARA